MFTPPQSDSVPPSPLTPETTAADSLKHAPAFSKATMFNGSDGDDSGSDENVTQKIGSDDAKAEASPERPAHISPLPQRRRLLSNSSSSPANLGRLRSGSDTADVTTDDVSTDAVTSPSLEGRGNGDEANTEDVASDVIKTTSVAVTADGDSNDSADVTLDDKKKEDLTSQLTVDCSSATTTTATTATTAAALQNGHTPTRVVIGRQQDPEGPVRYFKLFPSNASGARLDGVTALEDLGDQTLDLSDNYLALEWRNDERSRPYVLVRSKNLVSDFLVFAKDHCLSSGPPCLFYGWGSKSMTHFWML